MFVLYTYPPLPDPLSRSRQEGPPGPPWPPPRPQPRSSSEKVNRLLHIRGSPLNGQSRYDCSQLGFLAAYFHPKNIHVVFFGPGKHGLRVKIELFRKKSTFSILPNIKSKRHTIILNHSNPHSITSRNYLKLDSGRTVQYSLTRVYQF